MTGIDDTSERSAREAVVGDPSPGYGDETSVVERVVGGDEPAVLEGVVVEGDKRGRELGFPTANVELPAETVLPEDGVYAAMTELTDGRRFVTALSIGTRPTYYDEHGKRLVEAYLLGFDGDLYDQTVRVVVGERVRGQERFESSDELIARIRSDVADIEALAASGSLRDL